MLTYELKKAPGVPLYEALYRCIRQDILTGGLQPGELIGPVHIRFCHGFTPCR